MIKQLVLLKEDVEETPACDLVSRVYRPFQAGYVTIFQSLIGVSMPSRAEEGED